MKYPFVIVLSFAFSLPCISQSDVELDTYPTFIVQYRLGENWDQDKSANEQDYFTEHSSYLSGLRKEKRIALGARYSDVGMILLMAKDEEEAKRIIHEDLAVSNKLFAVEIHPFHAFYKGCVE